MNLNANGVGIRAIGVSDLVISNSAITNSTGFGIDCAEHGDDDDRQLDVQRQRRPRTSMASSANWVRTTTRFASNSMTSGAGR